MCARAGAHDTGRRSDTGVRVPVCEVGVRGSVELCLSLSTSEVVGCEELSRSVARRSYFYVSSISSTPRCYGATPVTPGIDATSWGGAKGVREWIYTGVQGWEVGV